MHLLWSSDLFSFIRSLRFLAFVGLVLFCICELNAQEPNDCEGAIVICDDGPVSYTPIGPGNPDFNTNTCGTTEHQSAWYYFEFSDIMPPNLILEFTITPNAGSDYDFAIWGPNVDCDNLDAAGMIRCNFSPIGITGLVVGGGGSAFEEALTVNPNEGYYLLVDNFSTSGTGFSIEWFGSAAPYLDCNANPNCELTADAGDVIYFCEGEPFDLVATVTGGNGNAIYNWKGNPPGVTQFIADTSAATTSVTIPIGFGNEFEFLLTVTEDSCTAQAIAVAVIQASSNPTFNLQTELCETDDILVLPTSSNEGVPGSWDPISIDPSVDITPINAVFTPNGSVGDCVDTVSIIFTISEAVEPLFSLPTAFCETDDLYTIPTTSDDGHTGMWLPGIIDPAGNAGSLITATFTTSDPGCFEPTEWTFEITPGLVPDFYFDNTICEFADAIVLDPFSIDGYSGQWSVAIIDPSGLSGFTISSTFTPDPVVGECLLPYTHEWLVVEPAVPEFPVFEPLCALDPVLILPTQSIGNDYFGTWSPAQFDPALLGPGAYQAVFTPDPSFGDCVADVLIEIEIFDELEVVFDPVSLCELDQIYILPTTTSTGVSGSWIPTSINPANYGGTEVTAIFTPEAGLCAQSFELIISIEVEQEIIFDIPLNMCELSNPIPLLNVSDNGIVGTWSNPILDPADANGDFIVSTFTPDANLHPCAAATEYITFITPSLIPEFLIPEQLCELDNILILETISLNGIRGQWTIPSIDPTNAGGNIIETTFIPDDTACTESLTASVLITSLPAISNLIYQNPSDCGIEDGSIDIVSQQSNSQYSIDGGVTWSSDGVFDQLPGGSYTILVRLSGLTNCITDTVVNLTSPGAPQINELVITDISDCNRQDGSLRIVAEGNMLEYSIDNGVTWQADSLFDGLAGGSYPIAVREINSPACQSVSIAVINFPNSVIVDSIAVSNVSDCEGSDGRLIVRATGVNLEYSIDNGMTWQASAFFDNLSVGAYDVLVRNSLQPGCEDIQSVEIIGPNPIVIQQVTAIDLTDCQSQDGRVVIDAGFGNFEYSIDGGLTFQLDSIFDGLSPGTYDIVVRRINAQGCSDFGEARIFAPNAPSIDSIMVAELTDCGMSDGQINLFASGNDLEYSIDNGLTWQTSSTFTSLGAGLYQILVRSALSTNCVVMQSVQIADLEPPLMLDIEVRDVDDCLIDNGSIEIHAQGVATLEYSLDHINWQLSNIFSNLGRGTYMIYVRLADYPDCQDMGAVEINGIVAPVIQQLDIQEITDCGRADGMVQVILESGVEVEYSIDGVTWQNENLFTDLSAGNYTIQARELNSPSCVDEIMFQLIDPDCTCDHVQFDVLAQNPLCHDDATGQIEVRTLSPNINFEIVWNTTSTDPFITNLTAGTYSFVVTYFDNCYDSGEIVLTNPDRIEAELSSIPASCLNADNGIILINPALDNEVYEYSVDGINFQSIPEFTELRPGDYNVVIKDSMNCELVVPTIVDAQADVEAVIEGINSYIFGDTIHLLARFDESRVDSFYWLDQAGRVVSVHNPLEIIATREEEFTFIAFYDDCEVEVVKSIFLTDVSVYFPNVFSPNNDGINDNFLPFASNVLSSQIKYDLQIYNRWGGKVFETYQTRLNNNNGGWDGRRNNKLASTGLYVYTSTVYLQNGRELYFTGEVQLLR